MNPTDLEFTEPERYELHEGPAYHFHVNRREFIQTVGAGLLISIASPVSFGQRAERDRPGTLAQRLHIGADGFVTVLTSKVEVGQGSRTQLTQAAAEELQLPIDRVRMLMADTAVVPDDGGTAGSRTTPATVPAIRKACAAARRLLVEAAAKRFQIEADKLHVADGRVVGLGAGEEFSYADLAANNGEALQRDAIAGVSVAGVQEWRVLGTPVARIGAANIVTGAHRYPSDIVRPGMLYGKVLRPDSFGAVLAEIDVGTSDPSSGVVRVRDGDFVGFAAPTSFAAEEAREAAARTAKWKTSLQPSSDELFDYLRQHSGSDRPRREVTGDPDKVWAGTKTVLRETYQVAYIQHAPMEPRAAVAEWDNGQLTVWTGTQQPARVREDLARALRLSRDAVRVVVPDTGGGFGGKHSGEVAIEAARLAQAARKPVCVRWSREDEFTWAYYRPAGVIELAGALDENGAVVAWQHVNYNSGASAIGSPYRIPNTATEFKPCDQPLRSGSYRALAATANTFARESFMDELAAVGGIDPLEFRLRHLTNERLKGVLVAACERFGWKELWRRTTGRQTTGIGVACGTEKGSYVACCVELEIGPGTYKLRRVCEAFECGAIQNPANLRAQVEGAVIQGMGGAMWEEIRFKDGKVQNPKFSQYRVPRFKDVPEIEVVLVNRTDLPSVGGGETPIIALAPAMANALFHATQTRIRSLPIRNAAYHPVV